MSKLEKGSKCPQFALPDQNGNTVTDQSFEGKKLLIYFYPKAMTPGCTTQSCNVRDALPDLADQNVLAIGISADSPERQKKFDDKYNLGFPLLADEKHEVAESFSVWAEKSMYGKKYMGIVRSAFLVDENREIIETWYKISPKNTIPNVLDSLK